MNCAAWSGVLSTEVSCVLGQTHPVMKPINFFGLFSQQIHNERTSNCWDFSPLRQWWRGVSDSYNSIKGQSFIYVSAANPSFPLRVSVCVRLQVNAPYVFTHHCAFLIEPNRKVLQALAYFWDTQLIYCSFCYRNSRGDAERVSLKK